MTTNRKKRPLALGCLLALICALTSWSANAASVQVEYAIQPGSPPSSNGSYVVFTSGVGGFAPVTGSLQTTYVASGGTTIDAGPTSLDSLTFQFDLGLTPLSVFGFGGINTVSLVSPAAQSLSKQPIPITSPPNCIPPSPGCTVVGVDYYGIVTGGTATFSVTGTVTCEPGQVCDVGDGNSFPGGYPPVLPIAQQYTSPLASSRVYPLGSSSIIYALTQTFALDIGLGVPVSGEVHIYATETSRAAVPEPGVLALVALGLAAGSRRRVRIGR